MIDGNAKLQSAMAFVKRGDSPRGVPVAGVRKRRYRCSCCRGKGAGKPSGVIARERLLSHRYKDEGETGPLLRRELRRRGDLFWRKDWAENP